MRHFIKEFCRLTEKTLDLKPPTIELGSFQVAGEEGFADLRPVFTDKEISVVI
jgi:hypothetical protein